MLEDRYKESDYKETSHMMESSLIILGNLQGEEFIVDNENENLKEIGYFL